MISLVSALLLDSSVWKTKNNQKSRAEAELVAHVIDALSSCWTTWSPKDGHAHLQQHEIPIPMTWEHIFDFLKALPHPAWFLNIQKCVDRSRPSVSKELHLIFHLFNFSETSALIVPCRIVHSCVFIYFRLGLHVSGWRCIVVHNKGFDFSRTASMAAPASCTVPHVYRPVITLTPSFLNIEALHQHG